jgi:Na+/H+-dicarboxylate symporter
VKDKYLHWKILAGLALGVIWAVVAVHFGWKSFTKDWIDPWGIIFIKLLKLIAIPLVMFSIISGIASLASIEKLGRIGLKTFFLYITTSLLAISTGLVVVNLLQPGSSVSEDQRIKNRISYEVWMAETDGVLPVDTIRYMQRPQYDSLVQLAMAGRQGVEKAAIYSDKMVMAEEQAGKSPLHFLVDLVPDNILSSLSSNTLLLQVIFFAMFFGIAVKKIPDQYSQHIVFLFESLNQVFMVMVKLVVGASPFFVFCLMAAQLVDMAGDNVNALWELLGVLMAYGLVVLLGLGFLLLVLYPCVYALWGYQRQEHWRFLQRYAYFFQSMAPAQLLAFSTRSSAATLPLTLDAVHKGLKVKRETSSFVLPIGATINMDGTSLYQAVAVLFLAQLHAIDLTIGQQFTIVITALLASIGSAAIPGAGLILLMMVLQSVHLNPIWFAIIVPIDALLDMARTVVNISGDGVVASLVERWEQNNNEMEQ